MSDRPSSFRPVSDVYTVLLIVACLIVGSSTIYLLARFQDLYGEWYHAFLGG